MLVATAGWTQGCHYVLLNNGDMGPKEVVVEVRLPHGSTKEQRLGSLAAAQRWLEREVESACLIRNEA